MERGPPVSEGVRDEEAQAVSVLRQAGWHVDRRVRRVLPLDGEGDGLGHRGVLPMLPAGFVEAYERAVSDAYDPRTTGGEAGGAGTRRGGLSRRAVVRDVRAFEVKRSADRKLRRLGSEILADLGGLSRQPRSNRCPTCGRLGAADWKYCPEDGQRMRLEDER
jgi:hypothetical protein